MKGLLEKFQFFPVFSIHSVVLRQVTPFFLPLYGCISERKVSLFAWEGKLFDSEKQSFTGAPCTGVGSIHNGEDRVTYYFRPNVTANNCLANICISNRTPGTGAILCCLLVSRWDKAGQLSTASRTTRVFLKGLYESPDLPVTLSIHWSMSWL